jgi:16S rRNA processing protein RimM
VDNWVAIGRLWRARGNRGELLGELDSSDPAREEKLKVVALEVGGERRRMEVEEVWRHDGRPVFKFAGVDSISDAERLEGAVILVSPEDVARTEAGAYSHAELVGCRVEGRAFRGESFAGIVRGIAEYGGPPLLQVESGGREVLIPFAREICREIDVRNKIIRVVLPDGLLETQ